MKKQKGQTLLELVVALGIALIIVSAVTVSVLTSLSNAQFNRDQSLSSSYVQQGMENVRKVRDQSWSTFSALNGTYCIGTANPFPSASNKTPPSCTVNIGTNFIREVVIDKNPGSSGKNCESPSSEVIVRVKWRDGNVLRLEILCIVIW